LIDRSAAYLRDAGYEVVDVEPPSIMDPARGWLSVLLTEIKATLGPAVDQYGSDDLRRIPPFFRFAMQKSLSPCRLSWSICDFFSRGERKQKQ
jgi:hypothetical protein